MNENVFIDTLVFTYPLPMDYKKVIGMFESDHHASCCEWHELDFDSTEQEFETAKNFITKVDKIDITGVEGMGINIRMYDGEKEFPIFVPGRGSNNGYYGDNIELTVNMPDGSKKVYDCTEYQNY